MLPYGLRTLSLLPVYNTSMNKYKRKYIGKFKNKKSIFLRFGYCVIIAIPRRTTGTNQKSIRMSIEQSSSKLHQIDFCFRRNNARDTAVTVTYWLPLYSPWLQSCQWANVAIICCYVCFLWQQVRFCSASVTGFFLELTSSQKSVKKKKNPI